VDGVDPPMADISGYVPSGLGSIPNAAISARFFSISMSISACFASISCFLISHPKDSKDCATIDDPNATSQSI
jgi:hypothetical protein